MATQGSAVLDFGTGTDMASVVVTGQTGILAGSDVEAFLMAEASLDNDAAAHIVAASYLDLIVGAVVAGTGFTIYGLDKDGALTGRWTVQWVWA